jgi:hypothetical protein
MRLAGMLRRTRMHRAETLHRMATRSTVAKKKGTTSTKL